MWSKHLSGPWIIKGERESRVRAANKLNNFTLATQFNNLNSKSWHSPWPPFTPRSAVSYTDLHQQRLSHSCAEMQRFFSPSHDTFSEQNGTMPQSNPAFKETDSAVPSVSWRTWTSSSSSSSSSAPWQQSKSAQVKDWVWHWNDEVALLFWYTM